MNKRLEYLLMIIIIELGLIFGWQVGYAISKALMETP